MAALASPAPWYVACARELAALDSRASLPALTQACSATHCLVIPLDVIKTRMQTDAAAAAGGTVAAAAAIFRDAPGRGLLKLAAFFNGLPPTAVGYLLQGGTKFGGYEMLKQRAYARLRDEGGEERVRKWQLPVMLSSAASAEMLATVAAAGATSRWPHSLARALALLTGAGLPSRAAGARACSRG